MSHNQYDRRNEEVDIPTMQHLLSAVFDSAGLDRFCADHFPSVYRQFGGGFDEAQLMLRVEREDLIQLRETLIDRFGDEELRTFCSDLGVDYDSLPARGKAGKARELVAYLDRRNRISELPPQLRRALEKEDKIQYLLQHCLQKGKQEQLLELVQQIDPVQYEQLLHPPEPSLVSPEPEPLPAAGAYFDLLVRIHPQAAGSPIYSSEASLGDGSTFTGGEFSPPAEKLRAAELDPQAYGGLLFKALFSGKLGRAYDRACLLAEERTGERMRVRIWIDQGAAELHALAWERLHYPRHGDWHPLAISSNIPFSRYVGLEEREPSPIKERPIRMLVVVANPADLAEYKMAPLKVTEEVENLIQALSNLQRTGQLQVAFIPGHSGLSDGLRARMEEKKYQIYPGTASKGNIARALSRGPGYHILHFLGHGTFSRTQGQATLFLEDDEGNVETTTDETLASLIQATGASLRLIFLAACESGARDQEGKHPFVGLAPRLIQVSVPAVVAMQERIPIVAARKLTKEFYSCLLEHGVVDRAMNQARLVLYPLGGRSWSTPALFMRLKEGQLFLPASAG